MNDLCVVFDVDDTLYLERDYVLSGFSAVGAWARDWLRIPDFTERCHAAFADGQRGRIFDTVLNDCGFEPETELIAALVALYRAHIPNIRLCEDAANALEGLAARYPVAIITDGPAIAQSRKVEALGLGPFASPICLTELMGRRCAKPSPVAFRQVERVARARRYVYIADNPLKDFDAPVALGWKTVRVRRPQGLHTALDSSKVRIDFVLSDCGDLPRLLSSL